MGISNVGEFGQVLCVGMGEDVSVNSGLEFILTPQLGPRLVRSGADGVSVGVVDKTVGDTELPANQYLEYVVKEGDLGEAGLWRKQGAVELSVLERVFGNAEFFTVLP